MERGRRGPLRNKLASGILAAQTAAESPRVVLGGLAMVLFLLGVGVRLLDLTDPPLDFHAWRQLRSATIARGMYYQLARGVDPEERQIAENLGRQFERLEPPIFERLVALTYLALGREVLWISRVYSTLFWAVGGGALYALARRLAKPAGAALSLGFYMLLPFGVIASRAFLPDPLMVMWLLLAAYLLFRWSERPTWSLALMAGLASGIAVLVKVFAVFPVAVISILLVLFAWGFKKTPTLPQVWAAAGIMIAIPGSYYLVSTREQASSYLSNWVLGFSDLLTSSSFYLHWASTIHHLFSLPAVVAGAIGAVLLAGRGRLLVIGLWAGYALIGIAVPSLIIAHHYYNLPLIPTLALSLAPLGDRLIDGISAQSRLWKVSFAGLMVVAVSIPLLQVRHDLLAEDYRLEPVIWKRVGESLPKGGAIIGLSHDYNTRLKYYGWIGIAQWPHAADFQMGVLAGGNYDPRDPSIVQMFEERVQGFDYFLVTLFTELEQQPVLKDVLYQNYPYVEGDGYILFDLRGKK